MKRMMYILWVSVFLFQGFDVFSQDKWYTQGNFIPVKRMVITLKNTLDFERKDVPVAIPVTSFLLLTFRILM